MHFIFFFFIIINECFETANSAYDMQELTHLIACLECDLIQYLPRIAPGHAARCPRCGALLRRGRKNSLEHTLALAATGFILFVIANTFPFLIFKMKSQVRQTTLFTGIRELYHQGLQGVALLVLLTTLIIPLVQLAGTFYVVFPLWLNRNTPKMMAVFRMMQHLKPWSMAEVFMLGVLIAIVKLSDTAQIVPGIALYSFMALIFVLVGTTMTLDPNRVWERWNAD